MGDSQTNSQPAQYIEIAYGTVGNRGQAIRLDELSRYHQQAVANKVGLYRSYYIFDETFKQHLDQTHSIKDYDGPAYLKTLLLDVDGKGTLEMGIPSVLRQTQILFECMERSGIPQNAIDIWFSGTGFHLECPDPFGFQPSRSLHEQVKHACTQCFGEGFDNIFDRARLIRVGGTFNIKAGRWKVPITHEELYSRSYDEIRQLADSPRHIKSNISSIIQPISIPSNPRINPRLSTQTKFSDEQGSRVITCVQNMFTNGPLKGARHQTLLRMVSAWKRAGITRQGALALSTEWAKDSFSSSELFKVVNDIYTGGYRYGCDDEIMSKHCSERCLFFHKKNYLAKVASIEGMEEDYKQFLLSDFTDSSLNLRSIYPMLKQDYIMYPGEFIVIIGDTGIGKTAWMQNIAASSVKLKVLYISLEVHQNLIFRRFVQIANKMTKEQVNRYFVENNSNHITTPIKHVTVVTDALDLDALERLIRQEVPHVVVVDTTDGIRVTGARDALFYTDVLGRGLKEIAQRLNVILFGIHHISKHAVQPDARGKLHHLNVHSGKGASTVEQKADKVIAIEGEAEGEIRHITSLKARDESRFHIALRFDKSTFEFKPINPMHVTMSFQDMHVSSERGVL